MQELLRDDIFSFCTIETDSRKLYERTDFFFSCYHIKQFNRFKLNTSLSQDIIPGIQTPVPFKSPSTLSPTLY